jgi:hypothetical protein
MSVETSIIRDTQIFDLITKENNRQLPGDGSGR